MPDDELPRLDPGDDEGPALEAARSGDPHLAGRVMFDVTGAPVGRIVGLRARVPEEPSPRYEVELTASARQILQRETGLAAVPADWVGSVREDGVHLSRTMR